MTKMKKIALSFIMTLVLSVSAFAESGLEVGITVPFGMGIGMHNFDPIKGKFTEQEIKNYKQETDVGFDVGVLAQVGYMLQISEGMGISILGEVGYSRDTFAVKKKDNNGEPGAVPNKYYTHTFLISDSIQIGVLPKFNIGAFAIGIGGGVKIPLSVMYGAKSKEDTQDGKTVESFGGSILDTKNMKDAFTPTVIPYVKVTADYSIFFTEKVAMTVGIYAGYDFGMNNKYSVEGVNGSPKIANYDNYSSFDIGAQVGFKFGPKA